MVDSIEKSNQTYGAESNMHVTRVVKKSRLLGLDEENVY